MLKTIRKRNSSFELLRIVAMIMIVSSHLVLHGLTGSHIDVWVEGNLVNKLFVTFFQPGGRLGVALFFMILGYFLNRRQKVSGVKKILFQGYFYGLVQLLIFLMLFIFSQFVIENINFKVVLEGALVPFSGSESNWWFLGTYIILMILVPGINYLINDYNLVNNVLIFGIVYIIFQTVSSPFANIAQAIFYYVIGASISKKEFFYKKNRLQLFFIFIFIWLLCCFTELVKNLESAEVFLIPHGNYLVKESSFVESGLLIPSSAIILFILFSTFELNSNIINKVAKSMFGVYLLSDGGVTRTLSWEKIFVIDNQYKSAMFPLIVLVDLLVIFGVCIIVDEVRQKIETKIGRV